MSILEVETFIFETFSLCFNSKDVGCNHVEEQRNYLAGAIDSLYRVGKITNKLRGVLHLIYFSGHSQEYAYEEVFGLSFIIEEAEENKEKNWKYIQSVKKTNNLLDNTEISDNL